MPRGSFRNQMQDTRLSTRRWVVGAIVLALLLAGLKTCAVLTKRTNPVDQTIVRTTNPAIYVLKRIGEGFISLGHIFEVPTLLRENNRLRQENAFQRLQIEELKSLKQENDRLNAALKIQVPGFKPVAATVIARPYDLWLESAIINAGYDDGVRLGNLVLNGKGVVGKITEVETDRSRVQLITSPRFRLGAVSSISRDEGVIRGVDSRTLVFDYIPAGSRTGLGEKIYSRGEETVPGGNDNKPKGQLLGRVKEHKVDQNGFLELTVTPAISPSQLGVVVVMTR